MNFGSCAIAIKDVFMPTETSTEAYVGLEHIEPNSLCIASHGIASTAVSQKLRFRRGDILFGKLRPYFRKVAIARFDGVCSTDIWVVRARKGFDQNFLFYVMASQEFVDFVNQASEGTRMPRAKWTYAENFVVPDIPIEEQKAIAKILSSLDDKIELNRRMNATLEEMARALFKAWFVDFEPVHANKENRPSVSASPEIAKLFPSEFDNGIPKGWQEKSLTEFFRLIGGGTPKTSNPEFWNGDIAWYSVVDAPSESDVFVINTEKKITQAGLEGSSTRLLRKGVTIISARGTVGKLAIAGGEMTMNQSCYAVEGKFGDFFNFYILKAAITELKQKTHGAVFDTITQDTFKSINQVLPTYKEINLFEISVGALMQRIEQNLRQNCTLSDIRDSLLPRLVSGKLKLSRRIDEDIARPFSQ